MISTLYFMMIRFPETWNKQPVFVILLLVALAAYVAGLFVDVTRDSSKYATVAREIYETGDFFDLKVHGEPYLQKPPMLFWMSAASFYLFGLSNFSYKLPVLLLSFFGLYSVYRLGKSMFNQSIGIVSAVILGSSQIYFLYNMDVHTDTVLQAFVTFSLWQLYDFMKTGKTIHVLLGFMGIGLSMLTKGPVGAVVPAFAVIGCLLFTGQAKRLTDIRWYLGTIFAFILIIPALVTLHRQFGWQGIRFFFWTNNFGRITGNYGGSRSDLLYYFYNLFVLFFPWVIMMYISGYIHFRSLIKGKFKKPDWFLFSGIWFFFIILTLSRGKLPNYIFILIPLFSVLTARYLVIAISGHAHKLQTWFLWSQRIVVAIAGILLGVMLFWLFPLTSVWQWLFLIIMVLVITTLLFFADSISGKMVLPSIATIAVLNFFLNQHVAPIIFSDQASVKAASIFNQSSEPGDHLYNYNYPSHELFFYSKTPVTQLFNDVTMFKLLKEPGNWFLTTGEVVERMPENEFPEPIIIPLKHVWINKLRFAYLNPATREGSFDTLYLLRSTAE